jgi:TP901 family phage tail tape measure protein
MVKKIGKADYILGADVKKLRKDLKGADASVRKSGKTAEKAYSQAATRGANKLGKAQGTLVKQSTALRKGILGGVGIGGGVIAFAALAKGAQAVVGAVGDSIGAAAELEMGLQTVQTVAKVSAEDLEALGESVQRLSVKTGKPTQELTDAMYQLVSAGVAASDVMRVLEDSTTLATGALSTSEEAVDLITSSLNAWHLEASDSTRVMDVWAKTVANGKTNAGQLAASIAQIAPIASTAGVSIEEIAAATATMTAQGTQTSIAMTGLAATLQAFLKTNRFMLKEQKALNGETFESILANEGLAAAIAKLNEVTGGDTFRLTKALGSVEAYKVVAQTTGKAQGMMNRNLSAMDEAASTGGVAVGMMGERMDTYAAQQERMNAAITVMRQEIGQLLIGPATDFAMWIADIVGPADQMSDQFIKIRATVLGVSEAAEEVAGDEHFEGWLGDVQTLAQGAEKWLKGQDETMKDAIASSEIFAAVIDDLAAGMGITTNEAYQLIAGLQLQGKTVEQMDEIIRSLTDEYRALQETEARVQAREASLATQRDKILKHEIDALEVRSEGQEKTKISARALAAEMRGLEDVSISLAVRGFKRIGNESKAADKEWAKLIKRGDGNRKSIRRLRREIGVWERRYRKAIRNNDSEAAAFAATRLGELEDERKARVEVRNKTQEQHDILVKVNEVVEDIPKKKTTEWTIEAKVTGERSLGGLAGPGFMHRGGHTQAGRAYVVGEKGPELWMEDRPGYMLDAAKTARALTGAVSGAVSGQIEHVHRIDAATAGALHDAGFDDAGIASLLRTAAADAGTRYRWG